MARRTSQKAAKVGQRSPAVAGGDKAAAKRFAAHAVKPRKAVAELPARAPAKRSASAYAHSIQNITDTPRR
ncbi:MAG: hypothetical protein KA383_01410 [Phycisphaerae bacterium]|nr:hypothetical protein [Phycisphaerae bacterium]